MRRPKRREVSIERRRFVYWVRWRDSLLIDGVWRLSPMMSEKTHYTRLTEAGARRCSARIKRNYETVEPERVWF